MNTIDGCELLLQLKLKKRAKELMVQFGYTDAIAYRAAVKEAMITGDAIVVKGRFRYIKPSRADGRATI